jgi:hypothetical protein
LRRPDPARMHVSDAGGWPCPRPGWLPSKGSLRVVQTLTSEVMDGGRRHPVRFLIGETGAGARSSPCKAPGSIPPSIRGIFLLPRSRA